MNVIVWMRGGLLTNQTSAGSCAHHHHKEYNPETNTCCGWSCVCVDTLVRTFPPKKKNPMCIPVV